MIPIPCKLPRRRDTTTARSIGSSLFFLRKALHWACFAASPAIEQHPVHQLRDLLVVERRVHHARHLDDERAALRQAQEVAHAAAHAWDALLGRAGAVGQVATGAVHRVEQLRRRATGMRRTCDAERRQACEQHRMAASSCAHGSLSFFIATGIANIRIGNSLGAARPRGGTYTLARVIAAHSLRATSLP